MVGGGRPRAGALPVPAYVARPTRAPLRPAGSAAALLHRLDLGLPARGPSGSPHPARGQRLLVTAAAVASARRELPPTRAFALDHADTPVREPEATRGARSDAGGPVQRGRIARRGLKVSARSDELGMRANRGRFEAWPLSSRRGAGACADPHPPP